MTKAEQVLIAAGDRTTVRDFRLAFQDRMRAHFIGAVERLTNRRVLTYESQVLFDPDAVLEILLLGRARRHPSFRESRSVAERVVDPLVDLLLCESLVDRVGEHVALQSRGYESAF